MKKQIRFFKLKRSHPNQQGVTMVEVLLAASISILIGMAVMRIMGNASKGMRKVETDSELRDFRNQITNFLSNGDNCANTFRVNYGAFGGAGANINMRNGTNNAQTNSGAGVRPQFYSADRRFYELSENGGLAPNPAYNFVVAKASNGLNAITSTETFDPDQPLPGAPNWYLDYVRIYQMDEDPFPNNSIGRCAIEFKVKRNSNNAAASTARSIGVFEKTFWINLNCSMSDGTDGHPNGSMNFCAPTTSIQTGYWSLITPNTPSDGIRSTVAGPVVIDGGQSLEIRGTGTISIDSDQRFKKDEKVLNRVSEKLNHINGYSYFMRTKEFPERNFSSTEQIGVFAQEVEAQFDGVVVTRNDGYKGVDYIKLIPVLIQAHKEQENKIKTQQEQIKALNRKIDLMLKKESK